MAINSEHELDWRPFDDDIAVVHLAMVIGAQDHDVRGGKGPNFHCLHRGGVMRLDIGFAVRLQKSKRLHAQGVA